MSANYWASSQRNHWQFTKEELAEARKAVLEYEASRGITSAYSATSQPMKIFLHTQLVSFCRELSTRQRVISTAEVYLTRFLIKASIAEINIFVIIATCVYIACKTEECPHHIRTVAMQAKVLWPDYVTHDAQKIAECEFYIIEELSSYLVVFHPYKTLEDLIDSLKSTVNVTPTEMEDIWSMVNDSYATDLLLLHSPHVIAVACLYIVVIIKSPLVRPKLPHDQIRNRIEQLMTFLSKSSVDLDQVAEAIQTMISLYNHWEFFNEYFFRVQLNRFIL